MDGRSKSITFQSISIPPLGRTGYGAGTSDGLRTPMRCLRLFVFAFLLPCALIAVPLYQRKVSLAPRVYTMTASDMREVQDGISSVWCEAQELTSEAPFTSYRAHGHLPQHSRRVPVTLRHRLTLTDDVREFWGFYLLRGSRISVSACARWPGTSLLVVHGWRALNECVWVGQLDSVEEESSEEDEQEDDDMDEAELDPVRRQWREFLKHHRPPGRGAPGVSVRPPQAPRRTENTLEVTPTTATRAQEARLMPTLPEEPTAEHAGRVVWRTSETSERTQGSSSPTVTPEQAGESVRMVSSAPERVHGARTSSAPVAAHQAGDSGWRSPSITERAPTGRPSGIVLEQPERGGWRAPERSQSGTPNPVKTSYAETQLVQRDEEIEEIEEKLRDDDEEENETAPSAHGHDSTAPSPYSSVGPAQQNPREGNRPVAAKEFYTPLTNAVIERKIQESTRRRRRRRQAIVINQTSTVAPEPEEGTTESPMAGRLIPLTYNGHRGRVNQTMPQKETSHSEMVSSFSSSEEALLSCEGVIVNQPLRASAVCSGGGDSASDQLTVQVIGDDYYYLVFSSENEMLPVDVFFDVMLEKTVYDVRTADRLCFNSTSCTVPLSFWSGDSVVLEYPVGKNASEAVWSEHYAVRSSCHSRGWIVAVFIVAALCSLFVCAFC
ncbi:uncharacterized protein LOC122371500 [Amphibalanus amphitrite]|uniref:uncharacterized protein LOC122371500 n=1 Tax=Amphibalanus amphitrite TaxID=1232801 RepID=UPI001C902E56|nr:uncharacterized protein LOC122371500 [Amphibalanus amphitrite]